MAVKVVEVFADDLQREVKGGHDVVVADVQSGDERFGVLALALQPRLFVVEELVGDAVFVVHVQQLALLLFDLLQDASAVADLLLGGGDPFAEVFGDRLAEVLALLVGKRDGRVVVLDRRFNEVDGLVALWATAALIPGADEVFVGAAVAFVARVGKAAAAGAAADGALEVVLVFSVSLAGLVVRLEDRLDLVEQFLVDERVVSALVDVPLVADVAHVVGVGQHFVDR